jgi:hypothetical protein
MMDIIGRGLMMTSQVDEELQQELKGFPPGFIFAMDVFPSGPKFAAQVSADQQLILLNHLSRPADLTIRFKHISHAFLVFSFQESTAQAFANDRMIADGDLAYAIRLVRCLNKMEAIILPKLLALRALKSYPKHLRISQKFTLSARIYLKIVQSYLKRDV